MRYSTPVRTFWLIFAGALGLWAGIAHAQVGVAPVEGLREQGPRVHALVNARLEIAPGNTVSRGCLVIRDGLIVDAGADVQPPPDARIWDLGGRTVYAGFIDPHSHFGLPEAWQPAPVRMEKPERKKPAANPKQLKGAGSWNPLVTPERDPAQALLPDEQAAEKLRALGFTNALVVPGRGIFRGQSALVDLTGRNGSRSVWAGPVAQDVAFGESRSDPDQYPDSLMGCVALIRQTFMDAEWYSRAQKFYADKPGAGERPETSAGLAALGPAARGEATVILETEDELDLCRAARIAEEFKLKGVLLGSGYEYRVLDSLKAAHLPVILPLTFPEPPGVESPEKAMDVSLDALEHWDQAPSNPARVAAAGVPFAFTVDDLDKPDKNFWKRVRLAVRRGLSEKDALAALTAAPARMLGIEARCGTLEKGKAANFIVSNGDLFTDQNAVVTTAWIGGEPFVTEKGRERDPRGEYALSFDGATMTPALKIDGEMKKLTATLGGESGFVVVEGDQLTVVAPAKALGGTGTGSVRLTANIASQDVTLALEGDGQLGDGATVHWRGKRTAPFKPVDKIDSANAAPIDLPPAYPAGAYGRRLDGPQPGGVVLVQNATIWTCGPEGKLEGADLLVRNGQIEQVGVGIIAPAGAQIIDGAGLHVTPGLIDCHSHTAISRGVNEATHAVTCEVRIGDVLDATDIALYRELAGGVTTANVLHGSANPIGGQNQVIKLRWGSLPEDLKFGGALPGVKFALGENVKQSNWGDKYTDRYPQTRMGVEEILRDTFLAARDYGRRWEEFKKKGDGPPPRRDLRLEAALEILNRQRIVHIHSYRQDELLMFIRLAQELGFTVGTFQHVLEGYKVADEIAKLGAGASTFSDWWGYKYEATDAIPQNGPMLQRAGVTVSYNSDSNELARRLNTEAAKAVKYGGLTEEQALEFVTINPARQLRIDKRTGSLEAGKDADFVIWNGRPLSTYSRAEQTWVDGVSCFDRVRDEQMRGEVAALRERLIQKALPSRQKAVLDDRDKEDDNDKNRPPLSDFERLLLHGTIHRALELQGLYQDGADRHNCSTADW